MLKLLRRLLILLALCGLIVLGGIAMFQDHLLYFPTGASVAEISSAGLQPWPSPTEFRGLVAEPAGRIRGTVVVFHGNAGHAGHRDFYAEPLKRLGLRVILAEYPGYGPREGIVGENSFVPDAESTITQIHGRYGAPLLVVGESLGAGVASAAVSRQKDKVAGLLLITPWDRLANVANHHYPWLPVKWLLRDRYDSAANLAGFGHPILVAVAEADSLVPARFGEALHQALPAPKRLTVFKGAEHNDWLDQADEAWWQSAVEFLLGKPGQEKAKG